MSDRMVMTNEQNYEAIADAIRDRLRSAGKFKPEDMADAIMAIPSKAGAVIETALSVEDGALVYDAQAVDILSQPVIVDDEISATASAGMLFGLKQAIEISLAFDYTIIGGGGMIFSFGGSNTNSGVITIGPTQFMFYANGPRVQQGVSISADVKHSCVVTLTPASIALEVDGVEVASGESAYCKNACMYIISGGAVALMFNQSAHSEYNAGKIDNLTISISME